MGECGGLLLRETKSYGAVRSNANMVTIDSKSKLHQLRPNDTLQSLAIKYGVSVEKLKRANKLWSNDSFYLKETLLIPCPVLDSGNTTMVDAEAVQENDAPEPQSGECQEKEEDCQRETKECFEDIFSKIDGQIKEYKQSLKHQVGSESYNTFNEMLSKIDDQIQFHKERNPQSQGLELAYETGYQKVTFYNSYTPPKRHRVALEHGI